MVWRQGFSLNDQGFLVTLLGGSVVAQITLHGARLLRLSRKTGIIGRAGICGK